MALFGLWALVGWCGTPWPGWYIWWLLHHNGPPPPPDPWPWIDKLAGVVGGVVGGWAFTQIWSSGQDASAVVAATSAIGAFVGSIIFTDVADIIKSRQISSKAMASESKR
jgi:uncharacterized membrane protein YeaQ/YmgE (transglycosylase-associated protein family)